MVCISVNTKYSVQMYGGVKIFLLVSAERRMSEGDLEQGAGTSPDVVQYPAVKQLFVVILSWLLINL